MEFNSLYEVFKYLDTRGPQLTFLTGRSSTGKTTLSTLFLDNGYKVIELDKVIGEDVVIHFNITDVKDAFISLYSGIARKEYEDYFIASIHKELLNSSNKRIVIEGSVNNPELLKRIFSEQYNEFTIAYLLPKTIEDYAQRLMKRFEIDYINGTKSIPVWPIPVDILKDYAVNKSKSQKIKAYIEEKSIEIYDSSMKRYNLFVESDIKNIVLLKV